MSSVKRVKFQLVVSAIQESFLLHLSTSRNFHHNKYVDIRDYLVPYNETLLSIRIARGGGCSYRMGVWKIA